jgi:hypothetical protein
MLELDVETLVLNCSTSPMMVIVVVVDLVRHLRCSQLVLIEQPSLNKLLYCVLVAQDTQALPVHVGINLDLVQFHMYSGVPFQLKLHVLLELLNR